MNPQFFVKANQVNQWVKISEFDVNLFFTKVGPNFHIQAQVPGLVFTVESGPFAGWEIRIAYPIPEVNMRVMPMWIGKN